MDTTNRISKYRSFKAFSDSSQANFENISQSDKKIKLLKSHYNLCICPGGSFGGNNDRLIEIFYGNRPFDTQRTNPFDRNSNKVFVERGARLHYNLLDNGYVVVILYPATTEHFTPIEDAIVLSNSLDPHHLKKLHTSHFASFNAYMRCTSLDGAPSLTDKIEVLRLRYARPLIVDGKKQQTKVLSGLIEIIKFAITVGLSGFLLAWILPVTSTPTHTPTADYSKDLQKINQAVRTISEQIKNLPNNLSNHQPPSTKKGPNKAEKN